MLFRSRPYSKRRLMETNAAWSELVAQFHGLLWATARACGLSEADAADVTQTTWMRLAEHLGRITEPAALPGWLVSTTRREAISRLEARPTPAASGPAR